MIGVLPVIAQPERAAEYVARSSRVNLSASLSALRAQGGCDQTEVKEGHRVMEMHDGVQKKQSPSFYPAAF